MRMRLREARHTLRLPTAYCLLPTADCLLMIYLDHNATTPLDPEVLEAMRPHLLAAGNAESRHAAGRRARRAWEAAKEAVAGILGAEPDEGVFTSGGTEANNLAIFGRGGTGAGPGP